MDCLVKQSCFITYRILSLYAVSQRKVVSGKSTWKNCSVCRNMLKLRSVVDVFC